MRAPLFPTNISLISGLQFQRSEGKGSHFLAELYENRGPWPELAFNGDEVRCYSSREASAVEHALQENASWLDQNLESKHGDSA